MHYFMREKTSDLSFCRHVASMPWCARLDNMGGLACAADPTGYKAV